MPPTESTGPARREGWRTLLAWLRDLAIATALCAFTILFVYQPFRVEGSSMSPTLQDEEMILVNKFVYRFEDIRHGDIVVFRTPGSTRKVLVKRVVGLPGDTVEIRAGEVLRNGLPLEEPYLLPENRDEEDDPPVRVPDGQLYVLGDHRNLSSDSRSFSFVPARSVSGKCVWIYWPPDRFERIR